MASADSPPSSFWERASGSLAEAIGNSVIQMQRKILKCLGNFHFPFSAK